MMWGIRVDYITGDSFSSETIRGEDIGIAVSSKDIAKNNLKRIREHYLKYLEDNEYDKYLNLELDNEIRNIRPFWIGYFQRLLSAEIYLIEDEDRFEL